MLTAISPVDGRYSSKTEELIPYFSEFALIRERAHVEIEYLIALGSLSESAIPKLSNEESEALRKVIRDFEVPHALEVKKIEATTNHDVKAVEYFLKNVLKEHKMEKLTEWIHFALTSQDINNTATPLLVKKAMEEVMLPALEALANSLKQLENKWAGIPMLAHTHGQPASPTTLDKEIRVLRERLEFQINSARKLQYFGKFGGATGNFNAHAVAFPTVDWPGFANEFLGSIGLKRIPTTTQIDHYDHLAEVFQVLVRISSILKDLCIDSWLYISMEYFRQKTVAGEVGSSTMPHKVNPIDFENAEGNLGIAIAMLNHLATKLPVSRLQRDLTDSTVLRNVGVPFAHLLISIKSLTKGLGKLELNKSALEADLNKNWAVVGEAIQTILRREGVEKPYELLKDLTRGNAKVTQESIHAFIDGLSVSDAVKEELKKITPFNYVGVG